MSPKKVNEMLIIKENKSQIEEFSAKTYYRIKRNGLHPLRAITGDQVSANLLEEEDKESDDETEDDYEQEEEVLYYLNDNSEDNQKMSEDNLE